MICPIPSYASVMRRAAAALLAVPALGGAIYLGSVRLATHHVCGNAPAGPWCAPASRAGWQLPLAVAIAALGAVGAVGVLKRT